MVHKDKRGLAKRNTVAFGRDLAHAANSTQMPIFLYAYGVLTFVLVELAKVKAYLTV